MRTVDRARGRWRQILGALGVEGRFLTGKHGPCPLCGGKDRYRFTDKDDAGWYYCSQCGPGTGLLLLRKLHGWDYKTACDEIDKIIGTGPPPPRPATKPDTGRDARLGRLNRLLSNATDHILVEDYLASRGLSVFPPILRGHRALPYGEDGHLQGYYHAMVAPVIGRGGELQSVHRTYLADVETRKKLMTPVDTVNGASIRLFEHGDVLAIAEGVETSIAAYELFGTPTWSVLNANGIETFTPPDTVARLQICADNDANFHGQKAAYQLANRLSQKIDVQVIVPPQVGTDWLDVLNERHENVIGLVS